MPQVSQIVEGAFLDIIGSSATLWRCTKHSLYELIDSFHQNKSHQALKALQKENTILKEKMISLSAIQLENTSLKSDLKMIKHLGDEKFCTASLVTHATPSGNLMFVIAAGLRNGIRKNQPVLSGQRIVGRIDAVSTHFARVMPASHQDFRIPVIGLKTRTQAMVAGNGSPYPSLTYIREDSLPEQEIFISSPQGGAFPYGLLVGESFGENKNRDIRLFVPWKNLDHVQVLLSYPKKIPLSVSIPNHESNG